MSAPASTAATAMRMVEAAAQAIAAAQAQLNALDSTVGDGDHGVNFAAALALAAASVKHVEASSGAQIFAGVAETLNSEMGGAAGVIFGAFFSGIGEAMVDIIHLDAHVYAQMLVSALTDVQQRGKAAVGDKTVVDALSPAAQAAQRCAQAGDDLGVCAQQAAVAAAAGAAATTSLEARKGRARYLGARAIGHADAGATSLALVLQAWAQVLGE